MKRYIIESSWTRFFVVDTHDNLRPAVVKTMSSQIAIDECRRLNEKHEKKKTTNSKEISDE